MRMPFRLAALGLLALSLVACSRAPLDTAAPAITPVQPESGSATADGANTSVPPAASVLAPAAQTRPDPAAGRTNGTMSRAQESSAMPMAGQNNDHSAPLTPSKTASSP